MKKLLKKLSAFMLCLIVAAPALADTAGLEWAAGGYLHAYGDVRFHMTAQIKSLVPYGDGTVEMMNALLDDMSVAVDITNDAQDTKLSFCVAGDPVVSLEETQTEDGAQLITDLLPNRILTSGSSVVDALAGSGQSETQFDFFTAIQEVESCYQELTDAILPYAEQKAANYSIKGVGASRWSRIARLTPEQGAELSPLIASVLGCGMDEAFREQLRQMTYIKGFIVGLYQTEENGKDLAVYIKGTVVFPDGAQRAISYQWAFATNAQGVRTDTYKFDMTKNQSPRDNREISATYQRSADDEKLLVDGQSKAIIRNPETNVVTTTTITHKLKGEEGKVDGSVTTAVRTAVGDTASTQTTTIAPMLVFKSAEGSSALSGKVHVEQLTGKNVMLSLDLLFDEKAADDYISKVETGALFVVTDERLPQSSLTQNLITDDESEPAQRPADAPIGYTVYPIPENETTVDLDSATEKEKAALMDEMSQQLAGRLLRAIARLPEESTALIRDNLSEEDYAAFLELLED